MLFVGVLIFLRPAESHAHLALRESVPAADSRLPVAPNSIRLSFTEPVELTLSLIDLDGPGGPIDLGTLIRDGDGEVLRVRLPDGLAPGEYRVRWQAVGRDGHPVRGEFSFVVESGALGPGTEPGPGGATAEGTDPSAQDLGASDRVPSSRPGLATGEDAPRFTSRSPLYAAVRWLMYVGIVGSLGAIGLATLLRSGRMKGIDAAYRSSTIRATAVFGILAILPLLLSSPLRLQAQSHVVFAGGVTGERFAALMGTVWGAAWTAQLAACIVALGGFFAAWRGRAWGWGVSSLAAAVLVLTPALSGHAAALGDLRWLAIVADALHVAGAGIWIGTLAALVLVAIPMVRIETPTDRGRTLAFLVSGFSPVAMVAAGGLVATGAASAVFQLTALSDLWTMGYGRLLAAKLLIVSLVLLLGAYNWRRMRPAMAEPGSAGRLRRTGGAEVTAALIVIMLTSVLVAVQPPARTAGSAPSSNSTSDGG